MKIPCCRRSILGNTPGEALPPAQPCVGRDRVDPADGGSSKASGSPAARFSGTATTVRRGLGLAVRALPAAGLVLLPKCPACLALYISLATGVGISMTTMVYVKIALLALAVVSICSVLLKWRNRMVDSHSIEGSKHGVLSTRWQMS